MNSLLSHLSLLFHEARKNENKEITIHFGVGDSKNFSPHFSNQYKSFLIILDNALQHGIKGTNVYLKHPLSVYVNSKYDSNVLLSVQQTNQQRYSTDAVSMYHEAVHVSKEHKKVFNVVNRHFNLSLNSCEKTTITNDELDNTHAKNSSYYILFKKKVYIVEKKISKHIRNKYSHICTSSVKMELHIGNASPYGTDKNKCADGKEALGLVYFKVITKDLKTFDTSIKDELHNIDVELSKIVLNIVLSCLGSFETNKTKTSVIKRAAPIINVS